MWYMLKSVQNCTRGIEITLPVKTERVPSSCSVFESWERFVLMVCLILVGSE